MSLLQSAPADSEAVAKIDRAFRDVYAQAPEGVFSAPGRVNIIGEHVDYQNGLCLPMAIDHRCFVAAARTDGDVLRMRSLQSDEVVEVNASELEPGRVGGWAAYVAGVVWAMRDFFPAGSQRGLDLLVDGYVPLGAGLSSSAALECAVAAALDELFALNTTPHQRIRASITAETEFAGAATGGLDQSASILALEGHALLLDCVDFSTTEIPWDLAGQDLALLIIDTRAAHSLVGGEYAQRRAEAEEAARILGVPTLRELDADASRAAIEAISDETVRARARHIVGEIRRVREFVKVLEQGTVREGIEQIGALLDASHDSLRDDYEVTIAELDIAVDAAREAGAHGARMTGGGFGGSVIALAEQDQVEAIAQHVAQAFENNGFREPQFFLTTPRRGAGRDQ